MRSVLTLVLVLAAPASTFAQEKSWLGESVLPTKPAKDIKLRVAVGMKEVTFPYSGVMPVKVKDDRGGSIRIYDSYREGWVDKADFVLAQEAPAYFDRRVQADPKDTFALLMRGQGFYSKVEFDKAIKDFDDYIRLTPTDATGFRFRGNAWLVKMEYDKAIADFNEAIRLNPKVATAYANRGRTWDAKMATCPDEKVRNGKRAVELAKKAQDANKEDAKTMDILAAAYACAGNFKEAVRWQERALENEQYMKNAAFRGRLELYRKMQPHVQK
jgi:tetratricopeptide (TPR) repeat protein